MGMALGAWKQSLELSFYIPVPMPDIDRYLTIVRCSLVGSCCFCAYEVTVWFDDRL